MNAVNVACPQCATPLSQDARFCGVCGTATSVSSAGSAERMIADRYRLQQKLGEGGMGAVFRAEQISLKRTVALKLLRPELSADAEMVRRFNAEAELAAKLNHPNTVTLYDYGQDFDGTLFIAMEFIEGRSLRDIIGADGPLALARVVDIIDQVCDSLADAHARGIVHRDLKPDNVMLSERGKKRDIVRVLDFGIAKLRDQGGDITAMPMTQAGALLGTPQYMAPEQIRGEAVDGRTDVYALGIMLYEMLTGTLPFQAPSLMAMLSMHLMDPPVPPSQHRPGLIPPAMEQLILSMLAKPPSERPPSMEAVAARLSELRAEVDAYHAAASPSAHWPAPAGPAFTPAPTSTPAPGFSPPAPPVASQPYLYGDMNAHLQAGPGVAQPNRRKRRLGFWLGLLGALAIAGAVAGFLLLRPGRKPAEKPAESTETEPPPVSTDFYVPPKRVIFDDTADGSSSRQVDDSE